MIFKCFRKVNGHIYVCWGIDFASGATISLLDFGSVPTMLYFCFVLFFIVLLQSVWKDSLNLVST